MLNLRYWKKQLLSYVELTQENWSGHLGRLLFLGIKFLNTNNHCLHFSGLETVEGGGGGKACHQNSAYGLPMVFRLGSWMKETHCSLSCPSWLARVALDCILHWALWNVSHRRESTRQDSLLDPHLGISASHWLFGDLCFTYLGFLIGILESLSLNIYYLSL